MARFFKFLIIIALVINLLFLFVLDGSIPSEIPLPSLSGFFPDGETAAEEENEDKNEQAADMPAENLQNETEEEENAEDTESVAEDLLTTEEDTENPAEGTEAGEPEDDFRRCMIVSESGSNIRSGAGMDFEIVTSYPYETVLAVTGEVENGWYPILAEDGTEGYIFETQIQILDENENPEDAVQIY